MLKPTSQTKRRVLITRPEKKAQQLALSLNQQGIACANQPLFDYQALASNNSSKALLTNVDILIFVSVAAVEFAHASYAANHWQFGKIFAVGSATQKALHMLGVNNVITPSQENSEGLLALPSLTQHIDGKTITIIRGNGGREHLANTLNNRGGKVAYLESYQRVWRVLAKDISKQWYQQKINCIVVTSNAILEKLVQLITEQDQQSETQLIADYWRAQCLWVATSERIANKAKQLGLLQVTISAGASEQALCATLQSLPC
jgi:uroporphyrinogen-III synthase